MPGPAQQQALPRRKQTQQPVLSREALQSKLPEPNAILPKHLTAAQRPRRPVHWMRPGEVQAPKPGSFQQVNGTTRQAAAVNGSGLLGDAPADGQPGPSRRHRLAWVQPRSPSNPTNMGTGQAQAQRPPQTLSSRTPNGSQRSLADAWWNDSGSAGQDEKQPFAKSYPLPTQSQSGHDRQIPAPQASPALRAGRRALAAAPISREQFLRNQAQVERQIAEHENKKKMQRQQKAQESVIRSPYTGLGAELKRKPPPPPQPVPQPPAEVVIPPDVTVRQLAQLLGEHRW